MFQGVWCVPGSMLVPAVGQGHLGAAITMSQEVAGFGGLGHQPKRGGVQVLALGSHVSEF